jgi:hypothetical protein
MFTKNDYKKYFDEMLDIMKELLVNYTDLVNETSDRAISNKIFALMSEDAETFKFIKAQKEKFI